MFRQIVQAETCVCLSACIHACVCLPVGHSGCGVVPRSWYWDFFFHWESFVQMAKKLWKCCHRYFWPRFVLSARHTPFVLQVLFFPSQRQCCRYKGQWGCLKKTESLVKLFSLISSTNEIKLLSLLNFMGDKSCFFMWDASHNEVYFLCSHVSFVYLNSLL